MNSVAMGTLELLSWLILSLLSTTVLSFPFEICLLSIEYAIVMLFSFAAKRREIRPRGDLYPGVS